MADMSGLENIFVGHYQTRGGFINWKKLEKHARKLLDFLQCDVDLSVPVKNLRTAEQQIIQLTKALLNEPKVLILDELTAVLQEKDIQNIFRIIGILKERGIGVIYISHRLDEVFSCCDSYTVLCDGRHVGSGRVCDIDKAQLIKMIIGRELTNVYPPINENLGEVVLELQHLTAPKAFTDISLTGARRRGGGPGGPARRGQDRVGQRHFRQPQDRFRQGAFCTARKCISTPRGRPSAWAWASCPTSGGGWD